MSPTRFDTTELTIHMVRNSFCLTAITDILWKQGSNSNLTKMKLPVGNLSFLLVCMSMFVPLSSCQLVIAVNASDASSQTLRGGTSASAEPGIAPILIRIEGGEALDEEALALAAALDDEADEADAEASSSSTLSTQQFNRTLKLRNNGPIGFSPPSRMQARIVGGTQAGFGEYPYYGTL